MGPTWEKKKRILELRVTYTKWDNWEDSNCTSMQTSGRSLAITCIRSSKGSNVRLSEGVYGPHATKIFTGSVITNKIMLLTEKETEISVTVNTCSSGFIRKATHIFNRAYFNFLTLYLHSCLFPNHWHRKEVELPKKVKTILMRRQKL